MDEPLPSAGPGAGVQKYMHYYNSRSWSNAAAARTIISFKYLVDKDYNCIIISVYVAGSASGSDAAGTRTHCANTLTTDGRRTNEFTCFITDGATKL